MSLEKESKILIILENQFDELIIFKDIINDKKENIFSEKKIVSFGGNISYFQIFTKELTMYINFLTTNTDFKKLQELKDISEDLKENLLQSFFTKYNSEYLYLEEFKKIIKDEFLPKSIRNPNLKKTEEIFEKSPKENDFGSKISIESEKSKESNNSKKLINHKSSIKTDESNYLELSNSSDSEFFINPSKIKSIKGDLIKENKTLEKKMLNSKKDIKDVESFDSDLSIENENFNDKKIKNSLKKKEIFLNTNSEKSITDESELKIKKIRKPKLLSIQNKIKKLNKGNIKKKKIKKKVLQKDIKRVNY